MAVETNKGDKNVAPTQTLTGMAAVGANGTNRRKRASSLLQAATALPSVESSLDEFISRANQTLTDPDAWHAAEEAQKQENESQREADQLRWRAAEQQLREGEAREQSLRRQLDGLQGRLAEAEARAAVAGSGSQDGVIADLKMRLTRADEKIANAEAATQQAEARNQQLAQELVAAKAVTPPTMSTQFYAEGDAEERIRIAELKAQKALAAAKASAAGLTVSPADIAAIESGLSLSAPEPAKGGTNWIAVAGAFIVGLGIMFGVSKLMQKNEPAPAPAPAPAAVAPAPAPAPTKPTITPIEEAPPAANAAAPAPTTDQATPPAAGTEPAKPDTAATAPVVTPPTKTDAPATAPAKHTQPAVKKAAPAKKNDGIVDPFATSTPAKKAPAKKAADKKPPGGIVDPF
jgi:hypothetical protein